MTFRPAQTVGKEPDLSASNDAFLEWVKLNVNEELGGIHKGCWTWLGTTNKYTGVATYKNNAAHGYIFKRLNGLLGEKVETLGRIRRTCRNLKCVNPEHAYLAEGPATRRNIKNEKMLEEANSMLTGEQLKHLATLIKQTIEAEIKAGTADTVREVIRSEIGRTAENVVAELIRIKFDEMIAKGVMDGLRSR